MKPSEMIESIDRAFAWWKDVQPSRDGEIDIDAKREAVIQYLRNSIPKPVVKNAYEEGWYDGAIAVSGERMTSLHDVLFAEYWAGSETRTALGIMEES